MAELARYREMLSSDYGGEPNEYHWMYTNQFGGFVLRMFKRNQTFYSAVQNMEDGSIVLTRLPSGCNGF